MVEIVLCINAEQTKKHFAKKFKLNLNVAHLPLNFFLNKLKLFLKNVLLFLNFTFTQNTFLPFVVDAVKKNYLSV